MIGRMTCSLSNEDVKADEDTAELVLVADPLKDKFKKLSDVQLDDEIKRYEELANSVFRKKLNLKDGGDKIRQQLQKLQSERSGRVQRHCPEANFVKEGNALDSSPGDCQLGSVGDEQCRGGTEPILVNGLNGGSGTSLSVKTDGNSAPVDYVDDMAFDEDLKAISNTAKIPFFLHNSTKPPPSDTSPSLKVITRGASGEQAHPSCWDSARCNQADQPRLCGVCAKSTNTYNIPGLDNFLCSVCRKKSKAPELAVPLNCTKQTPVAKLKRGLKRQRDIDIIGRTPDTAVEIGSSDEDENASRFAWSGVILSRYNQLTSIGLQSALERRMEDFKVAYPSRVDPEAVEIVFSDIQRLDPLEFLNDTVIDFYIKYIQRPDFLGVKERHRFHFFNTFFYKKLCEVASSQKKKGGADFSKLRKWTRGTNIFEKDYLFVPIHDKLHWSLAIICFPGFESNKGASCEQGILHLDSMRHGHSSQVVFRLLRSYLVSEWKHGVEAGELEGDESIHTLKKMTADNIFCKKVPVPLQENESDCGLFLLHYIYKFVESAPKAMKASNLNGDFEDLGVFGHDWFLPTEASHLRTSIQEQLQFLFEQEEKERGLSNTGSQVICNVVAPLVDLEVTFE